jgi:hypothetical protein
MSGKPNHGERGPGGRGEEDGLAGAVELDVMARMVAPRALPV